MEHIRKILFPTRFDTLTVHTVEKLYPLRHCGLEEIVLLFVVNREEVAFVPYGGFDRKLADEMAETARLRFADWAKEIEGNGLRCKALVETGKPAGKILEAAREEAVDLIVTGRERHEPIDSVYLGGTAMEVLRRSPAPVLVYKYRQPEEGEAQADNLYERVLYPTDFSKDAQPALEFLEVFACACRHVDVVHVIPQRVMEKLGSDGVKAEEQRRLQQLEEVCAQLRESGVTTRAHLRAGEADKEILSAAGDNHSTVIVLGTTEKEGLREFWFGSVSHRVAELSPMPVILIPSAGHRR